MNSTHVYEAEQKMFHQRSLIGRNHQAWVDQEIKKLKYSGPLEIRVLEDVSSYRQLIIIKADGKVVIKKSVGWFELLPLEKKP